MHVDDTPVPVLAPGTGKTKTGRLWTYVRDERPFAGARPPAALFFYSPDRKGEHPQAHLKDFRGVIHADGYAGFNELFAGDGFETGVHAERAQEMPDVVLDRLGTQVELLGDLLGRASLLEQAKHLGLPGCEVRGGRAGLVVCVTGQQSEDSDDAFTVFQRHRADVQHETRTVGGDQDAGRLGRRRRAEHLAREELACPSPVLGADDGREVPSANVAEQALCRRVDPPDDPVSVEHVAGDRESGQSLFDIAADCEATPRCRHSAQCRRSTTACHVRRTSSSEGRRRRRPSSCVDRGAATAQYANTPGCRELPVDCVTVQPWPAPEQRCVQVVARVPAVRLGDRALDV